MSQDPYNLARFVQAQESIYSDVRLELRAGRKTSHWMWFIFPQIKGLGHSATADLYGISSEGEAEAYLDHPILGERLIECVKWVNEVQSRTAEQIFGYPDYMKFHSCLTLFSQVAPDEKIFEEALIKYFDGRLDPLTLGNL